MEYYFSNKFCYTQFIYLQTSEQLILYLFCYYLSLTQTIIISAQATSAFKVPHIEVSLRLTREPENAVVSKSQSTTFRCSAESSAGTPQFAWLLNGNPVSTNDSRFEIATGDGTLTIREAAKRFEGVYYCLVTNNVGSLLSNPAKLRIAGKFAQQKQVQAVI